MFIMATSMEKILELLVFNCLLDLRHQTRNKFKVFVKKSSLMRQLLWLLQTLTLQGSICNWH